MVGVLVLAGCGSSQSGRTTIDVRAPSPLADSPVELDVRGLPDGEKATLRATWKDASGATWTSSAPLRGNATLRDMRFLTTMRILRYLDTASS
jgi:hypothetical protein